MGAVHVYHLGTRRYLVECAASKEPLGMYEGLISLLADYKHRLIVFKS